MTSPRPSPAGDSERAAIERYKRAAAQAAAELVADGERVGLGTGSTVAHLLPALAARQLRKVRCVATSPATAEAAQELGLVVVDLDELGTLDIAIDGADQIDPRGWLIKGAGGAQTREKIVAAAALRFVVIASAEKAVAKLSAPVPVEVLRFGAQATLRTIGPAKLRDAPPSPDGNLIADYLGPIEDPGRVAAWLSATPGLVGHGLFAPAFASDILIAGAGGVEHRQAARDASR
jgi:ribose 5-phosphate isomerase A